MKVITRRECMMQMFRAAGGALAGATLVRRGAAANAARKRLNFVFILIDDMGYYDIQCNGSEWYETPNINRLAAEGVRFTNGYAACPVCSPTRASIVFGQYPQRTGVTNFIPGSRAGRKSVPRCRRRIRPMTSPSRTNGVGRRQDRRNEQEAFLYAV